jgi:hypothetical protein
MAKEYYDGKDNYLIYAENTGYTGSTNTFDGGTPAISENFGRLQSVTLNMNNNLQIAHGIGDGITGSSVQYGNFDVSGTINCEPIDFTFLQYGVGNIQTSAGTGPGGENESELVELPNVGYSDGTYLPTIKLELGAKALSNHQEKTINGVVFNSWTLSGTNGEKLQCTIDFTGSTVTRGTTIETYSAPSGTSFTFINGSFKWNAETLTVTDFSITCDLNPTYPREVFNRFGKLPTLGVRRYTWSATILMHYDNTANTVSSNELLSEFFGDTNSPDSSGNPTGRALVVTVSEGSSSGDKVLTLQFANAFITSWSENPSLEGGQVPITVSGIALAGTTEGSDVIPVTWYTTA